MARQALALKQNQGYVHIPPFPLICIPTSRCSKLSELKAAFWAQIKDLVTSEPANLDLYVGRAKTSRQVCSEVGQVRKGGFRTPRRNHSATVAGRLLGGALYPGRWTTTRPPAASRATHAFPARSAGGGSQSVQACGSPPPG